MNIPKYNEMMLPLLVFLGDNELHTTQEIQNYLIKHFNLSDNQVNLRMPNVNRTYLYDRISWAKTYLRKAMLIESPSRSTVLITERGNDVLNEKLDNISKTYLMKFEEFRNFTNSTSLVSKSEENTSNNNVINDEISPEELMSISYSKLIDSLTDDLIEKIKSSTPFFFENLVVDLLVRMGYGGTLNEAAGQVVGKSHDGGIDGIIKEDKLGLDAIYIQAKRWENVISSKEIREFVGALAGKKAKKGVFITTSSFSKEALNYVNQTDFKIILIDGKQLAHYMIEYNVGISVRTIFEIKQIDQDYFELN